VTDRGPLERPRFMVRLNPLSAWRWIKALFGR
jgi:hypothetical protein